MGSAYRRDRCALLFEPDEDDRSEMPPAQGIRGCHLTPFGCEAKP
jgi:hypothetical protein